MPRQTPRAPAAKPKAGPVTVTRQPVTRCDLCGNPVTYEAGKASEVLTAHYNQKHLEDLADAGVR